MLSMLIRVLFLSCTISGLLKTSPAVSLPSRVFQEVMRGPLADWSVVMYLDPGLDTLVQGQLLALPALQDTPRVLVNLGSNGTIWSRDQHAAVLRGTSFVHVVVFKKDPRPFFDAISNHWNPKYLMLFCLGDVNPQNILRDYTFRRIEKLVFISQASPRSRETARIYTYFPFSRAKKLKFKGFGNYTVNFKLENIFIDRFPLFENYEFQIGTWFNDFPFLYPKKNAPEGIGDGVAARMLDAIAESLDYRYTLTPEPPDCLWGSFINDSWTGMLGMVHRGEKDFTVNTMSITEDRFRAFDVGVWYWMEGFGLMLMDPPPLAKWRGAYYPFSPSVWLAAALTFTLAVLIMTLQDWIQPEPFLGGLGRTWTYMLRTVVNRELPVLPRAHWQRVFVGSWLVYCFVLTTAFTANLIAFLTIPVFPERLQTLHQLAYSDYRVAMKDYGEFVAGALKSAQRTVLCRLGEKLDLVPVYDDVIALLNRRTHAFLDLYFFSQILVKTQYQVNGWYMMQEQLYPSYLGWHFQKNTAWKYKFDHSVQRLVEAGLVAHWHKEKTEEFLGRDYERREHLAVKEHCVIKLQLSLDHLQGVFFIFLLSWAASVLVFILELLLHAYSSARSTAGTSKSPSGTRRASTNCFQTFVNSSPSFSSRYTIQECNNFRVLMESVDDRGCSSPGLDIK